jgi:hypothetical protein
MHCKKVTLDCFSVPRTARQSGRDTLRAMSEQEPDAAPSDAPKSEADQTLMGVAPPRVDSSVDARPHSPVYVRSGTSVSDVEPVSQPRFAAPSPPRGLGSVSEPPATMKPKASAEHGTSVALVLHDLRTRPILWMVLLPVACALSLVALTGHRSMHAPQPELSSSAAALQATASSTSAPPAAAVSELENRPAGSLSSREVVLLAEAHAEKKRAVARTLREQLARDPASGKENALHAQLLELSADPTTAPDALSAMALLEPPTGADLLYEVWTGTTVRTDTTELARALLYSTDVRPKASPALSVALDLRVAEACEQYQTILPKALTDGDSRSAHLLAKLNAKHGCGAKKNEDCYACLRSHKDELKATISAAKSRRAPGFATE